MLFSCTEYSVTTSCRAHFGLVVSALFASLHCQLYFIVIFLCVFVDVSKSKLRLEGISVAEIVTVNTQKLKYSLFNYPCHNLPGRGVIF